GEPGVPRVVVPGPPAPGAGPVRSRLRRWGRAAAVGALLVAALLRRRQQGDRAAHRPTEQEDGPGPD
ncbi:MAG TPA: hypothetical protein VGD43_15200, partial [Micromonospora sp.]